MIFEVLANADDGTLIVAIDRHTFNKIHKMLIVESYHLGKKHADLDDDDSKEN